MSNFTKKELTPPKRIGVRLKEIREEKEMSLDQIAKITKIEKRHLEAMEKCQFETLPCGLIYQKNFLKKYLKALGVDSRPFVNQLIDEEILADKNTPLPNVKPMRFSRLPLFLRFAGVVIFVIIFLVYLGFQIKHAVEPPKLTLFSPENGYISDQATIFIQGETEKETHVSVNGKEIGNNDQGQFSEVVDLNPGLNTITIVAEKKHGKKTSAIRYIVLKNTTVATVANIIN